jgi:hypothetical protein
VTRDPQELRQRRDAIREELVTIGDLRPGSLVGRYRRCGKPTCHCAREGDAGHGPSWSLTRAVKGRTVTRVVPARAVEATRAQIAEYRRLRRLTGELVEASEALCDALLAAPGAAAVEGVEKGGSKGPSRQGSRPRSRRS